MIFIRQILLLLTAVVVCHSCTPDINPEYQAEAADPEYFHRSVKQLTDVIVHDIFSPPVASRIYAYPSVAAYEVMAAGNAEYQSLAGQLNELEEVPRPDAGLEYCLPLAATHAYLTVGRQLIFSEEKMAAFQDEIYDEFRQIGMPEEVFGRSLDYGQQVADHIIAWAGTDNYKETRTFPKYSLSENPARWQPTPPAYMDGIEPHWREIRPFVLDSAQQFKPAPPTAFSTDTTGLFWKEVMEVYHALEAQDRDERIAIASFWDCNPYVSHHKGHVMFATKKITPGGHWIGITSIVTRKAGADLMRTVEAYALTSVAMADAFISCWDEKYRSNLVRPETVINLYIDENWAPALQTPPFPEYTSGHSVVSRAAATVLTSLFGDDFAFADSTEEEYGLPTRNFDSFYHASDEAAVSRLYGGIHYRPAIDNGVKQGEAVGRFVVSQVKSRPQLTEQR